MIKAVIFDMDGLLIDSEPLWKQVNNEVYGRLGVKLTQADRNEMMGRTALENAEHLYAKYHWKRHTPQEVRDMIWAEMAVALKQDIKLMPGAHRVLQLCRQAGLPTAIASSSRLAVIEAVVDKLKVREHFAHLYSAQHEPYGKPHPGVFIKVAEHFHVPPADCLVFEDTPNGVLAAKAARMHCIAVPDPSVRDHPFIRTADVVLDSLEDFDAAMFKKL